MSSGLRNNLTRGATWIRGLYMLLFAVAFNIAEILLAAVAIFQFLAHLITGGVNRRVQRFGDQLATYVRETGAFLTYASSHKPWPFGPWPDSQDKDLDEGGPMGPGTDQPVADDPSQESGDAGGEPVANEGDQGDESATHDTR